MTDEQRKAEIAALLREKEGYVQHGKTERAEAVQAQIDRLTRRPKTPAQRATRMTAPKRTEI